MKLLFLTASLLIVAAPAAWAADAPNPYLNNPPAQTSAYPVQTFNWFNPYAWMALMTTQPVSAPGQAATPASTAYPAATFNWFDPNAWAAMFFPPPNWTPPQPAAGPGAKPAASTTQPYVASNFNWFDPNAWATFFNPATWAAMSQPAAAPGK